MKSNWWLRFGCYLIGYNYELLCESGEASRKSVKKYTSAILIVMIIWSMNGYNFAVRYVDAGLFGGILASFICCLIIVQIERQIILTIKPNKWLKAFRYGLAILMAIIGSVIIDQILFSKDLDQLRESNHIANVTTNTDFDYSKSILDMQLKDKFNNNRLIDSLSGTTRNKLNLQGGNSISTTNDVTYDSTGKKALSGKKNVTTTDATPLLQILQRDSISKTINDKEINIIRNNIKELEINRKQNLKPESKGFLGEIKLLFDYIFTDKSRITLFVYFFWFALLFILEILVLIAKSNDEHSDYERRVMFELDNNNKKIDFLSKKSDDNLR